MSSEMSKNVHESGVLTLMVRGPRGVKTRLGMRVIVGVETKGWNGRKR
jgi:hypothetical protein